MKRILSGALASLMLLGGSATVFADDAAAAPTALTLADTSHLVLDADAGYVDKIDGDITVAELKANFASAITVKKDGGDAKADDAFVATDDIVAAADNSLKALIYGDVDRTGKINLTDVSGTMKHVARWNPGINEDAADVDKTGSVNLQDASKILKVIAGWPDLSLGNVRMTADNVKLEADAEDSRIDMYFESSMVKIGRSEITSTGKHTYKMMMARNETESCQVILTSTEDIEGLTVELSDFEHEYGEGTLEGNIFFEYYYELSMFNKMYPYDHTDAREDYFPEVLLPTTAAFEIAAGTSQGFMIKATADKEAPAGMYRATLSFKNAEGEVVKTAYVYTYVWDFTLPDTPYSASSFGMSGYGIYAGLGMYEGDDSKTHAQYYDFLLDHNISAYQLPYRITDPRADAYMSDPRVTSFEACGENLRRAAEDDPEYVKAAYAKVTSNPVWESKYHLYYVDEPTNGGLEFVKEDHAYLTDLLGTDDFNLISPLASNTYANSQCEIDNIDAIAYLTPYLSTWCPQSPAFEPLSQGGTWNSRRVVKDYGDFQPRYEALREAGNKMWWYICISPQPPYPNYFTPYQGVLVRTVMWQQFMYDVDGILYWATQYSWDALNDKRDPQLIDMGDGTLLYLGERYGYTGPMASWRLCQIRESFDEFDYMRMAEELVGRDAVMAEVNKVTTGLRLYTEDHTVLEAARVAIAEMIVEAQEK